MRLSVLVRALLVVGVIVALFLIAEAIDPSLIPQPSCAQVCGRHK